jgi:multicomponent Na+:H+ antiporter subunit E
MTRAHAADVALRTLVAASVWWVLVEGEGGGWLLATVIPIGAVLASLRLVPVIRWRVRPIGLLRFAPFFIAQSMAGGIDVARRALDPRLPVAPGFMDYPVRLPPGAARLFFTGTIGLLPGTLSVALVPGGLEDEHGGEIAEAGDGAGDARIRVHLLDSAASSEAKLRRLEERVADLFGVRLEERGSSRP